MKKLLLLTLLIAMAVSVSAQGDIVGIQGGAFLQEGYGPEVAYALSTDISVTDVPLINKLMSKAELSAIYSNRVLPDGGATEIYGVRAFTVRQYLIYGWFYAGIGVGTYYLTNTDGGDDLYAAARVEIGAKLSDALEIYIGGDIIDVHDCSDMFYPHVSVSFTQ